MASPDVTPESRSAVAASSAAASFGKIASVRVFWDIRIPFVESSPREHVVSPPRRHHPVGVKRELRSSHPFRVMHPRRCTSRFVPVLALVAPVMLLGTMLLMHAIEVWLVTGDNPDEAEWEPVGRTSGDPGQKTVVQSSLTLTTVQPRSSASASAASAPSV